MRWQDVPCREWSGATTERGYGARRYKGQTWLAHRAEWDKKMGAVPEGIQVLHRCDNRPCREIRHLFLGTVQDNMQDMVAKGRQARGEKNGHAILTAAQVIEMRARKAAGGVTQRALAAEYGVSEQAVCDVIKRRRWAHV
ncbi:HNH endonuclease signature motif containing protein [Streptomyces mirabilis]|uniref:HNH endonuclease signature motif containing protein n=1 Tax=Streptomyces mirabilis TaxID=68239 RepID=UPI003401B008